MFNFSIWKRRFCHILFQDKIEYVIDMDILELFGLDTNADVEECMKISLR